MLQSPKTVISFLFAALLGVSMSAPSLHSQPSSPPGKGTVKVMTYNVNEGSDFVQVLSAQNFADFVTAVQGTLTEVEGTNPPLRMQAIAHQIAITQPDLVGLQEVSTWFDGPLDSLSVRYDMLQELMDALAEQGLNYQVVKVVPEF